MSRPKTEINPVQAVRLKTILEEQGISQVELSKKIQISQQTISRMMKGSASVTPQTASLIVGLYPQYRAEWLLGYDDYKSTAQQFSEAINQMNHEGDLLMTGLLAFAQLSGYSVTMTAPAFQEGHTDSIENILKMVKDGYTIEKEGRSVTLSLESMNKLQNDICDYVEFKLSKLLDSSKSEG